MKKIRHKAVRILKLRRVWAIGVVLAIGVAVVPIVSIATSPTINEYSLPANPIGPPAPQSTWPDSIASGPDGSVWFAEYYANRVGKINPSTHLITEYNLATPTSTYSSLPQSIIAGPDGNMWFVTDRGGNNDYGSINKITTNGSVTSYPVPAGLASPFNITVGPDGNLWFTTWGGSGSNGVGVISTNGTLLHDYPTSQWARGISTGPDGKLWFVYGYQQIAKMEPADGTFSFFSVPYVPYTTAAGPGGSVWFASSGSLVGRIDPSTNGVTVYNVPVPSYTPPPGVSHYVGVFTMAEGPDGNMWFPMPSYGLGTLNVNTGTVSEFEVLSTGPDGPSGDAVTTGPDAKLWFTSATHNPAIGALDIGLHATPTPTPTPTHTATPTPVVSTTPHASATPVATATPSSVSSLDKVGICHATGSATNPYEYLVVDENGLHAHASHVNDLFGVGSAAACPKAILPSPTPTAPGAPIVPLLNSDPSYVMAFGTTHKLATGESVRFLLGANSTSAPEYHQATVKAVGKDTVDVVVQSQPIQVHLQVAETREVDVDGDGHADLRIKLASVLGAQAQLIFSAVASVDAPASPSVSPTVAKAQSSSLGLNEIGMWVGLGAALLVLILILAWTVYRKTANMDTPVAPPIDEAHDSSPTPPQA